MTLHFYKMHGAGNDYIYLNMLDQKLSIHPQTLAPMLSSRHFGIGGDGVVLICPSQVADAEMRMYNQDGSEGMMCGNALRCVGKYLYEKRGIHKNPMKIATKSGQKEVTFEIDKGTVKTIVADMGKATGYGEVVCFDVEGVTVSGYFISLGNPHLVVFEKTDNIPLEKIGNAAQSSPRFPDGVNVELVKIEDSHHLSLTVWERGTGVTLACGSGACGAVAVACALGYVKAQSWVKVSMPGGVLDVLCEKDFHLHLRGDAQFVFEGDITIEN